MSRVVQNKKILVVAFALVIALVMLLAPMNVYAANTYKIVYSAGNVAAFTDDAYAKYESLAGSNGILSVEKTKAGNIKLEVAYGAPVPNAPNANDIKYKDGKDGRYTLTDTWTPVYLGDSYVNENKTYVMDYEVITDGVAYKILYLDEQGYQLAPAVVTLGNIGETRTPAALAIDGYTCTNPTQSIALNIDAAKNVVTFTYTANAVANEEGAPAAPQAPVAQPAAVPGAGGAPAADVNNAVENVADEDTPLSSETTPQPVEKVADEETPHASAQSTMLLPIVIVVIAAVAALITFIAIRADKLRRKDEGR